MRARLLGDADRETFNDFIAGHPKGHILQSFEWGEVKASTGWKPHRLILEDSDRVRGAVSILERRLPGVKKTIFYAPRGPVLDFDDQDAFQALIQEVRGLAKERKAILWKIDPDIPKDLLRASKLKALGFRGLSRGLNFEGVQPRFVFRLSITDTLDEVFARFSQKTRYNIRLAERKGVTVRSNCTEADLTPFYSLLKETCQRDGFLVRGIEYYRVIWRELVERDLARLFVAEYEGRPIAAKLSFIFGDKVWYVYGASGNAYRNVMPNHALQWAMIQWAKSRGCTMYDFRGVSGDLNPDNPLYGLYRFKKGFGGEFVEFTGEFDYVLSPAFYRLWNWGEPCYRHLRGRLADVRGRRGSAGESA